jgi:hypothetical protein
LQLQDEVSIASTLTLGAPVESTGAAVRINDALEVAGSISHPDPFVDLSIADNLNVTGNTNFGGFLQTAGANPVWVNDQTRIEGTLTMNADIQSTSTDLTINDNLRVNGNIAHPDPFVDLTLNDNITVTGIANFSNILQTPGGTALTLGDDIAVTGNAVFDKTITADKFVMNDAAAGSEITFGDANPNRTGLTINNTGGSPTSIALRIGNTNRTQDGITVNADRYGISVQSEAKETNSAGTGVDGMIIGGVVSTIGDVGGAIIAKGTASASDPEQYANAIILQNGAFAVGGSVMPAGKMDNVLNASASVTVNNPLCTSSSVVMITPTTSDAVNAGLYVSTTSNGSFVVSRTNAGAANIDFNYFIVTVVTP